MLRPVCSRCTLMACGLLPAASSSRTWAETAASPRGEVRGATWRWGKSCSRRARVRARGRAGELGKDLHGPRLDQREAWLDLEDLLVGPAGPAASLGDGPRGGLGG